MALEDAAAYGETFACIYDDWYSDITDVDATVRTLSELVRPESVSLELGVGTGRLAIPFAKLGHGVVGVDASASMLARCAAKDAGPELGLVQADMAALPFGGARFEMAFVAFNTLFNLTTEQAQRRCVADVATALAPGGRFVVEAFVPSAEPTQRLYDETARSDGRGGRVLTTSLRDPQTQVVGGVHVHQPAGGPVARYPWQIRYLHPQQLDELCTANGLVLEERWNTWDRQPFTPDSERHITVYRLVG
jgi:ubiquinone/menaquinone biosynthesis C-methylase UbiE